MATQALELDKDAFMRLVTEEHLQVEGPTQGYLYTGRKGTSGWELYRTVAGPWDLVPVSVGVTANPAAGASPAAITVPPGKRWLLMSLKYTLVTSADAANRRLSVTFVNNGQTTGILLNGTNLTASITWHLTFAQGISAVVSAGSGTTYYQVEPLPYGICELNAGATITTGTVNIQAADDYNVLVYAYKEISV